MSQKNLESENLSVVERILAAFDRRWPTEGELDELLDPRSASSSGRT